MRFTTIALIVSASLATLPAAQTKPDPRLVERFRRVALPQFHDVLGWRQPMYYSTIQTADVDGDGQDELLARWLDGLHVYARVNGAWLHHSLLPALSDNEGFTNQSWYASIHTAVLDPRLRQADVIARKADGVHVFRYDRSARRWSELGASATNRPFADPAPGMSPALGAHALGLSLHSADLTKDGTAELIGLGPSGIEAYTWNAASQSWSQLATARLSISDRAANTTATASSMQLADLDRDGVAELLIHSAEGVQTYQWTQNGFTAVGSTGPFRAGDAGNRLPRIHSVRATVDANGTGWLHGLVQGSGGPGSGAIQIHQWRDGRWQIFNTINLIGSGWNDESRASTLMAANIQGDATPEFLIRGADGLQAYTVDGRLLATSTGSFTDAQGWNLPQHYETIRAAQVKSMEGGNAVTRTVVLGRGRSGIEMYRYQPVAGAGAMEVAADDFPKFCTDPNSGTCKAFLAFSAAAGAPADIRSRYGEDSDQTPQNLLGNLGLTTRPDGATDAEFKAVRDQLATEINDLSRVHAWFANNNKVMSYMYGQSANSLNDIYQKVTLSEAGAENASIGVKWAAFALNIIGEIAGAFVGEELTIVTGILSDVLEKTVEATEDEGGEARKVYGELSREINGQQDEFTVTNASAKTAYLTSWEKLQQIAALASPTIKNWASETPVELADAQVKASLGLKRWAYKPLASAAWHVWACRRGDLRWIFGGCDPAGDYPRQFYCQYEANPDFSQGYNAYVVKRNLQYPRADALQEITGTGANDYDISYYPLLLAGLDDWELESSDENLRDDLVRRGGSVPPTNTSGCYGGGSRTGLQSVTGATAQTVSARLASAGVNYKLVYPDEAQSVIRALRSLRRAAGQLSPDSSVSEKLDSPLREAIDYLRGLREPLSLEQQGSPTLRSVPGSRPARMVQSFLMRVQGSADLLGQRAVAELSAQAYQLLALLDVPDPNAVATNGR
jgi:hypothetical protein